MQTSKENSFPLWLAALERIVYSEKALISKYLLWQKLLWLR
jgi:hypothetical protein